MATADSNRKERPKHLLFLSHAGVDLPAAKALAERIKGAPTARESNLDVWLDCDDLEAGTSWQAQLERVLEHECTAFAVYVGSSGIVNWVESEVRVALARSRREPYFPFVPVLAKESEGSSALPAFVREYQAVVDVERDDTALAKLISAATRQDSTTPVKLVDQPFIGLRAFEQADARLFFGRDAAADDVVQRLRRCKLIMVVGDSGSGKSSLVKAGVIPRYRGGVLRQDHQLREQDLWHVIETRPRSNPFDSLADSVANGARALEMNQEDIRSLRRMIRSAEPREVVDALRDGSPTGARLLVVVDQFEELFTLSDRRLRQPFIDVLMSLAHDSSASEFRVILTMRRDYYNLCHEYSDLYTWTEDKSRGALVMLRRMSESELRECIERPLALAGARDTSDFVDHVLADVGDQPGELALLEMALTESWLRRSRHGGDLLRAYSAIGGTAGALAHVAEEVFESLGEADNRLAEAALLRLVRLGETGGTTRRVAKQSEFFEETWLVLQGLAAESGGRLVYISGETSGDDSTLETVELSHEALVTQWPRYQTWLQNDPDSKRIHDALMGPAWAWFQHDGKGGEDLLTGVRLSNAVELFGKHPDWLSGDERRFVAASRKKHMRRKMLQRALVVSLIFITVASVWMGYIAIEQGSKAVVAEKNAITQRDYADQQRILMQSRWLAGRSKDQMQAAPDLALLLAVEASRLEPTFESYSALFSALHDEPRRDRILYGNLDPLLPGAQPLLGDAVSFHPDGGLVAAVSGKEGDIISVWDLESGKPAGPPIRSADPFIGTLIFSADGQQLVSGGKMLSVLDWRNGTTTLQRKFESFIYSMALSRDLALLATGHSNGKIALWDTNSWKLQQEVTISDAGSGVTALDWSKDSSMLAIATSSGGMLVWEYETNKLLIDVPEATSVRERNRRYVYDVAFSRDGSLIAFGSRSGDVILWALKDGAVNKLHELKTSNQIGAKSIAFNAEGSLMLIGLTNGLVEFIDTASGKRLAGEVRHGGRLATLSIDAPGEKLATFGYNHSLVVWDLTRERSLGRILTQFDTSSDADSGLDSVSARVSSLALDPAGETMLIGWTNVDGADTHHLEWRQVHNGALKSDFGFTVDKLAFGVDGKQVALLEGQRLSALDLDTSRRTHLDEKVVSLAGSTDGKLIVAGLENGVIARMQLDPPALVQRTVLPGNPAVKAMASVSEGSMAAVADENGDVWLWPVAEDAPAYRLVNGLDEPAEHVAFDSSGRYLVVSIVEGLRLYQTNSGKLVKELSSGGFMGSQHQGLFVPNKPFLLWNDRWSHEFQLLDKLGRQPIGDKLIFPPFLSEFGSLGSRLPQSTAVAFTADGKNAVVAYASGSHKFRGPAGHGVAIFDLDLASWQRRACSIANRNLSELEWEQYFEDEPYREICTEADRSLNLSDWITSLVGPR